MYKIFNLLVILSLALMLSSCSLLGGLFQGNSSMVPETNVEAEDNSVVIISSESAGSSVEVEAEDDSVVVIIPNINFSEAVKVIKEAVK